MMSRRLSVFHNLSDIAERGGLDREKILIQAKALAFCGLPYRRTDELRVTRRAPIGRNEHLLVTYSTAGPDSELPYGADRALLAWIQTRSFKDGFLYFDTLHEFLDDFGLDSGGKNYRRFHERLRRVESLVIHIEVESTGERLVGNVPPIRWSYTPKTAKALRRQLADDNQGQQLLVKAPYGFKLDVEFWEYLRSSFAVLPLELMRVFHARPRDWDLAQFLLVRCAIAESTSAIRVEELGHQLGSVDSNPRRLTAALRRVLEEIHLVYPDFPAEVLNAQQVEVGPWRPLVEKPVRQGSFQRATRYSTTGN